ncbi:cysteine-rich receptor-like protein kinase [Tanacetum coccineum]
MMETKANWDPTDVVFENWLASRFTNHRTMDLFTKNALWDYWKMGDDEIALTNGKVFDLEEEYSNDDEPTPIKHYCEPFSFKSGHLEWPACSWKDDGYCNGGNLPGTFRVGNTLHYQDLEWYEALDDSKLKGEALKNKAIMYVLGFAAALAVLITGASQSRQHGPLEGKQKSSGGIFDNIKYLILFSVKCKYVTRNTGKGHKMKKTRILTKVYGVTPTIVLRRNVFMARHVTQDPRGDQGLKSWKNSTRNPKEITLILLLYLIVHKPHLYHFDHHVTLSFGSIADGLDHVSPVIRLTIERGINSGTRIAMAGVDINTLTIEQYLALSQENQAPGVVKPEIRGNVNFEIKSQFMRELREETLSGNKNKDAHDHVDRVLNIVSLFNIPGVSQDVVLLRVFLFTLTGTAKRWVDRLTPGAVNTWDLLKKAFIQRYCPPSKTAKRLEYIHKFKQEIDESLYQAWERFNDLLYKCPTHDINSHQKWHDGTLSRSLSSSSNTDGLAAIVSKLDNLGRDIKKLKENVHAIQVRCQICEGPHLDKECPLNEEVKQVEEAKYGEAAQLRSTEIMEQNTM